MKKKLFGKIDDKEVYLYTLENDDATLEIMTRGATIVSFKPFEVDVVAGFDTFDDYLKDTSHHGAVIGRVANRIENASFSMDGAVYILPANNNGNCLHGGIGFDYKVWDVKSASDDEITLAYYSPDGEEGFPSGLLVEVTYILSGATVIIEYRATPEAKTPIALTNHAYFNLDGFGGTVYNHRATIYADRYTEVNDNLIPNGNHPNVEGTPFDFRTPRAIGKFFSSGFEGYDHNYVLSPKTYDIFRKNRVGLAAIVENDSLKMSVYTDQPGIQFYTANYMVKKRPDHVFRGGIDPIKHGAFCLEAQTEPNCVNRGEGFYEAGETYKQTTVYKIEKNQGVFLKKD